MDYQIIDRPYLLYETISMLHKYANGLSFRRQAEQKKEGEPELVRREIFLRAGKLQQILQEVCQELDTRDPVLQKYFRNVELDQVNLCLAHLLCFGFITGRYRDYWPCVEEICGQWRQLRAQGARLAPDSGGGLQFTLAPGPEESLFCQVKALRLPAELRLELYEALEDFEGTLRRLARWMEPYALALEKALDREQWIMEQTLAHWERNFRSVPPLKFVEYFAGAGQLRGARPMTRVMISLMGHEHVAVEMGGAAIPQRDWNILMVGSCVSVESITLRRLRDLEALAASLKCLGDRKRLTILRRLGKEQAYGLELAESMGVDSGNMSRLLSQLHQQGFLVQEKGSLRNYYRTDRAAIHKFLEQVEAAIFDEEV